METEDWSFVVINDLQSEIKRLREALERITHCQYGPNIAPLMDIARAALAPSPVGEKP